MRTAEGTTTVSVYDDEAGAEESPRQAADWVRDNAGELTPSTPQVTGGEVLISLGGAA
ncbi:MAG: hypothetical protein M3R70_03375 [Actinomycetota bacterium]|nr:hypothetical protein [Actinomycetota bacterium]